MFGSLFPTYVLESEGVKGEWKGDNLKTVEFQGVKYFKVKEEGLFVRRRQTSLNKLSPHKHSSNVTLIRTRKVGRGRNVLSLDGDRRKKRRFHPMREGWMEGVRGVHHCTTARKNSKEETGAISATLDAWRVKQNTTQGAYFGSRGMNDKRYSKLRTNQGKKKRKNCSTCVRQRLAPQ